MTQNEKQLIDLILNYPEGPEQALKIACKIIKKFLDSEDTKK